MSVTIRSILLSLMRLELDPRLLTTSRHIRWNYQSDDQRKFSLIKSDMPNFMVIYSICRQCDTYVGMKSNYCLQCVEYITENEKIQEKCEELTKENRRLKAQIRYLTSKGNNTQKKVEREHCQICDVFLKSDELRQHLCMDQKEIVCEYCPASVKSTIDLCNHLTEANHMEMNIYRCDRCSMGFLSAILLEFHQLTHGETINNDMDVPLTDKRKYLGGFSSCEFLNVCEWLHHFLRTFTHSRIVKLNIF